MIEILWNIYSSYKNSLEESCLRNHLFKDAWEIFFGLWLVS